MANCMLSEALVIRIVGEILPGWRARTDRNPRNLTMMLEVSRPFSTVPVAIFELYPEDLVLSWDAFASWLKGRMPPEWFPKTPAVDAIDFDKTG